MAMFTNAQNVVITGGTFTVREVVPPQRAVPSILDYVAYSAMHDSWYSHSPPKCHPNTRLRIQDQIMQWIEADSSENCMYWLTGPAGTGKTAIARSIARLCKAKGILVGSFFFRRLTSNQSNTRAVITTIANHLTRIVPEVKHQVESAIRDPSMERRSLWHQLHAIILEPLSSISDGRELPFTIVLDGLDECYWQGEREELIQVFCQASRQTSLHLKVFITSRPEYDIQDAFRRLPNTSSVSKFDLSEDLDVDDDIRLFLSDMFTEIKTSHPLRDYLPEIWPPVGTVDTLVSQSSGQFVYPATIIKYLESARNNPATRLDILLGLRPTPTNDKPFAQLDALYTHVLSNTQHLGLVLTILACIVAHQNFRGSNDVEFQPKVFDQLLSLEPGESHMALIDLLSIIRFDGPNQSINILHASLTDFLLDRSRAGDAYFIGDMIIPAHVKLTRGFLKLAAAAYPLPLIYSPISPSFPLIETYIQLIQFHCSEDSVLEQVVDDLIAFDVPSSFSSFRVKYDDDAATAAAGNRLFYIYVKFVMSFMHNEKAERVHHHHRAIIDGLIRKSLPAYLAHPTLVRFLVLVSVLPDVELRDSLWYIDPKSVDPWYLVADSGSDWLEVVSIDAQGLQLHLPNTEVSRTAPYQTHQHQNYLSSFLRDSTRSADLALNASDYISTVDYLCDFYPKRRLDYEWWDSSRNDREWTPTQKISLAVLLTRLTEEVSEQVLDCLVRNRQSLTDWFTNEGVDATEHHRKAARQIRSLSIQNYTALDPLLPDMPAAPAEEVKNVEDSELLSNDSGAVGSKSHHQSQLQDAVEPGQPAPHSVSNVEAVAAAAGGSFVPLILVPSLVVVAAMLIRRFSH